MSSFKTETKLQLIYFDIIYSMHYLNNSFIEPTYAHLIYITIQFFFFPYMFLWNPAITFKTH